MVDREVSPAYVEDAGKRSVKQAFQEQARGIIDCLGAKQEWWAAGWNPPGDKVDGLAIDATGRLLVIEVKPGTASTKEFAKAPLQVAMYVWWVTKWIEDDPAHAREVLLGMAGQRTALGLFGNKAPKLGDPIRVVPVIAIG